MSKFLPYDPGVLPTEPAPAVGQQIDIHIEGLPPYKDEHFSIRNRRHKIHPRFLSLREAAIKAMAGRAPFRGAVGLDLTVFAPELEKNRKLVDYLGGVMDTLDGSHGTEFTFLPIAYEDDCQVASSSSRFHRSDSVFYELTVIFLAASINRDLHFKGDMDDRAGEC